jgi:predicted GIY-YIG superfamily endonuclease
VLDLALFDVCPLLAVCGQNIRKVPKKTYGPDDLVSVETQTEENYAVYDEKTMKNLQNAWRKLR